MKMTMSKISLDSLNKNQKETLIKLAGFFKKGAILSGGTALMLQFSYRKSYDLDLFFPYQIPDNYLRLVSHELTFTVSDRVKVSFIYFPFARKYRPLEYNSILISSYEDVASDKAYALGRRPAYRDYIDLFLILKEKFPIGRIILDAKEKFGGEFSEKLFLSQLIYFEDIKDFTIDFAGKKYEKEEVLSFFKKQISVYKNSKFQ